MIRIFRYVFLLMKKHFQLFLLTTILCAVATILQMGVSLDFAYLYSALASFVVSVSAIIIFAYQNNNIQLDYYFSLPMKRWKIFLAHQLCGFIIAVVPFVIGHLFIVVSNQLPLFFILTFGFEKTFLYLIICLVITLSHQYFDTITLIVGYLVLPYMSVIVVVNFLNWTLKGFYLKGEDISYILQFINFNVSYHRYLFAMDILIYSIWFIIISAIVLTMSYYFATERKVENIGGKFPHNLIYTSAKIGITLLFMISSITSMIEFNFTTLTTIMWSKRLIVPLLVGYIAYIFLSLIQYRRLKNSFVLLFQYTLVVIVFIVGLIGYTIVKAPLYEDVTLSNVQSIGIQMQKGYSERFIQPLTVYNRITHENSLMIEDQQFIKQVEKNAQHSIKNHYEVNIAVHYQNETKQLKRTYSINVSQANSIYNALIKSTAYQRQLEKLFKENKEVQLVSGTTLIGQFNVQSILNIVKTYPLLIDTDTVEYRFVYDLDEVVIKIPLNQHNQFLQQIQQK